MDRPQDIAQDFLWRSWTALGVRGTSAPIEHLLVDPEGLIILTALAGADARLVEEVIDWCSRYFSFVSVTRFRNLAAALSDDDRALLNTFTARVNAVSSAKWPDGGHTAKPIRLSGKSKLSSLDNPALAQLRYRAIFGATARAEILLCLGRTSGWLSTSDIARSTGHKKRITARSLDELRLAGLLKNEPRGNRIDFRLTDRRKLQDFAGPEAESELAWVSWARVLSAVRRLEGKKATVQRIEIARVLEDAGLRDVGEPTVESIRSGFRAATGL